MSISRLRTKVTGMISRGNTRRQGAHALLWLALAGTVAPAMAQNALEGVTSAPGQGGRTEITLDMARPPSAPKLFTIGAPPRIALDLADTRNALPERRVMVGLGAAEAVTAVEAGGRTRVIVELERMVSYTTRIEGDKLIVSLDGGSGMAAAQTAVMAANDPTKIVSVGQSSVSNLDFRRGGEGEGRVIIGFNNQNASANVRREGNRLLIDLPGTSLAGAVPKQLDVTDFATPVDGLSARSTTGGSRVEVMTNGNFEHLAYQTGSEYIIEVTTPKVVSEARRALDAPVYRGQRVTFNFQDIPVRSVLQLIADVSDLNIVVADTVQGNVTLRLDNVPWDQALDIVMNAKGLDKRQSGNVIWVAPQAEITARETQLAEARARLDDNAPLMSEYIQVNYGKAKDIAELLTSEALKGQGGGGGGGAGGAATQSTGFLSARGSVTFDERTNVLLVNDTPPKINEIRELVARLDRPVDQVLIESRIVIATETFGREIGARFGISAGYEDRDGNIFTTGGSTTGTDRMNNIALNNRFSGRTSGLPVVSPDPLIGGGTLVPNLSDRLNVNLPVTNPAGSLALAILGADYLLDLELSALETEGRGEVVSNPRVITANQREAVIRQGDEVGYVTISPQSGGGAVPIPNVQFKEVLLELKVTPTITQDQRVFLNMNVKKDEVSGFISTSIGDVPQIQKRELNTAVLVDNGQTVVLGGVYEFSKREDLRKVPFLGDIPGLGALFRNKNRSSEKAELLIFVTPKILAQSLR